MKKVFFCLILMTSFAFSNEEPKTQTYNFGQSGMELVARSKKGTVIISTYNSKMTIRKDIANKIYGLYLENKLETDKKITVNGLEANVTGKCVIRKKKDLTAVDFYYETVEWNNGLKEIYKRI
ncbi:hypothetical protein EZL74_04560 [Flavobacterium silvisoli]|uniref:Uncharacterized protein n=1 Tax=Flavobacterium silvisoli TaxID=2529433 RepID=A0A4V6N0D8_9FLAO|nr:hypothetical protein [Flavobacterium silvisoli]TBX70451.1 hypothetical protein EZL74_04560 [Flavobacterium silvisoli]